MSEKVQVKLREVADFATRIMLGWPGSEEKDTAIRMSARLHAVSHSIVAEEVDGLLLATVHVYLPLISPVIFRVWRYSAVIGLVTQSHSLQSQVRCLWSK